MNLKQIKEKFELTNKQREGVILKFKGIDGYDVYNCSMPFEWKGKRYIYGRVEKPDEWARSRTMLFERTGADEWTRVTNSMIYQLEDPNIAIIDNQIILSGVLVYYRKGSMCGYQNFFYKGNDIEDMYYFTMGPKDMKDVRLVELPDKKIGVFSRPRNEEITKKIGSASMIGFTTISNINELCDEVIDNAKYIPDIFDAGEWGGVNQAYYLESGKIGLIGHKSHLDGDLQIYTSFSFIFDPDKHKIVEEKMIATRKSFLEYRAKKPHIVDCTFPSGIVMREDGMCDLYCGISDSAESRIVIPYPFERYGKIISFSTL